MTQEEKEPGDGIRKGDPALGDQIVQGHDKVQADWKSCIEPESRWIKVSDRLPEPFINVLVTDGDILMAVDFYSPTSKDFVAYRNRITHWQPRPNFPKKEE